MRRARAWARSTGRGCARRRASCWPRSTSTTSTSAQVVGTLSVGNRQRVEIAKALSQNARILIMDEPTAALTERDVERLFAIVRLLRARGVGIVYISHRLEEIFLLADRVTVFRDGEYVGHQARQRDQPRRPHPDDGGAHGSTRCSRSSRRRSASRCSRCANVVREPTTNGVSLTLRAGEILGLAGLVGSGRSELAQVVFGITPADSGEIRLGGQPVSIRNPAQAKRLGIAYVPEDRGTQGLVRPMPISENVSLAVLARVVAALVHRSRGRGGRWRRPASGSSASAPAASARSSNKLSGGNQQKVVLGKWLASEPKLLILDEPTRGIDVGAKAEIHRLMSELARPGHGAS